MMSTQEIQSVVLPTENETRNNKGKGRAQRVEQGAITLEIERTYLHKSSVKMICLTQKWVRLVVSVEN
jgi:hypothetical protein